MRGTDEKEAGMFSYVSPEQRIPADHRSERLPQLQYNLLFRWFVGLSMDDRVWDVTFDIAALEKAYRS